MVTRKLIPRVVAGATPRRRSGIGATADSSAAHSRPTVPLPVHDAAEPPINIPSATAPTAEVPRTAALATVLGEVARLLGMPSHPESDGTAAAATEVLIDVIAGGERYQLVRTSCCEKPAPLPPPPVAPVGRKGGAVDTLLTETGALPGEALSPREQEIARMVARGYPNKTIAAVLAISPYTVNTYLRRIFAKLDVCSRAAMVSALLEGGYRHLVAGTPGGEQRLS